MPGNITYSIDFAAEIARLVENTDKGARAVKDMADRVEAGSNLAKSAIEALGITLSVAYFEHLISGAIESTARMGELAIMAGTLGSTFSAFEEPARTSGTSLDTVAASVAKLSKSIGEAKLGDAAKANLFKAMGIDLDDGRDVAERLQDVSRALVHMEDKDVAAFASQQLLSRGFSELRPFMAALAEQGHLNATMTDEQIARAKELKDEYQRLKLQGDINVRQIADGMLPALKGIVSGFSDSTRGGHDFVQVGEAIGTALKSVTSIAYGAASAFELIGKFLGAELAAVVLASQGKFSEAWAAIKEGTSDITSSAEKAGERINKVWDDTAAHATQAAKEIADAGNKGSGGGAEAGIRQVMDDKKHYQERLAALTGFSNQFAAGIRLANELANEAYREGAIGQRQLIEMLRANEDAKLQVQIESAQKGIALARRQGDLAKAQELANGVAQAQAAIQANNAIANARLHSLDVTDKQEAAKRFTDVQRQNLTEREQIRNSLLEKQRIIDLAEATGLYDAAEIARQRELVEVEHQARLGDIVAQGVLARRNFEQLTMREQVADVFQNLANITAGAAQHNRTLFEINKVAGIANAIINTAAGATKALAAYPPPFSFAMAAAQIAAGLIQVSTIKSQSFDGGGSAAAPVFSANPNTGFPTDAISAAPAAPIAPPQQTARSALKEINITFVGSGRYTQDEIRESLVPALNEALGDGVTLNIN